HYGNNFHQDRTVTVEGQEVSPNVSAQTTETVTIPARSVIADGTVPVSVATAAGTAYLPGGITYEVPKDSVAWQSESNDFGHLSMGAAHAQVFLLRNLGRFPVTVANISVLSTVDGAFEIGSGGTCVFSFP